jgi:hypothetical protein
MSGMKRARYVTVVQKVTCKGLKEKGFWHFIMLACLELGVSRKFGTRQGWRTTSRSKGIQKSDEEIQGERVVDEAEMAIVLVEVAS